MRTGWEAVAIDNFDPIARKPRGALTVHGCNARGQRARARAHQFRRGGCLKATAFVIDRDDGGPHVGCVSPVRRPHRGLHTKDHLAHPVRDGGKEACAGVWLLRGTPIPQIEAVGAQHPLQRGAYHDGDGTLFHKSFKHLTKHEGLLHGKIEEGLSYTISPHLYTAGRYTYLNLDGGFDSTHNRQCIFNAGMIPNITENPHHRKATKRGRKRLFNAAIPALRMRVERTFAWEDKCKRLLLRFERIQQRHYDMTFLAYTLTNLRKFCGT